MDVFGGFGHDLATWTTHETAQRQEVSPCTDSLLLGCSHLVGSTGLQVESAEDVLIRGAANGQVCAAWSLCSSGYGERITDCSSIRPVYEIGSRAERPLDRVGPFGDR